jgi:hypothetical protein
VKLPIHVLIFPHISNDKLEYTNELLKEVDDKIKKRNKFKRIADTSGLAYCSAV